jgi:hypothetical protein
VKSALTNRPAQWGSPIWVIVLMAACAASMLALPASALFVHVPRNYNEGWNAYFAQRALSGSGLYPENGSLIFNNYPPLSFYLVGALGHWFHDNVFAGRIVSCLSLGWIIYNISSIILNQRVEAKFAVYGALVFILLIAANGSQYIGANDPQLLGHAFQTYGLSVLLREKPQALDRNIVFAVLLMLAGSLVKHNLIAMPLAVTMGLLLRNQRGFAVWLSAALVASAIVTTLFFYACGATIFNDILLHPRVVSLEHANYVLKRWIAPLAPGVVFAAAALVPLRKTLSGLVLGIYLFVSTITALIFGAGEGVSVNTVFDLMIAVGIGTALCASRLASKLESRSFSQPCAWAMMLLLLPIALHIRPAIKGQRELASSLNFKQQWALQIEKIAEQNGPVACESLSLCYWAGKDFEVDFFNAGQAIKTGKMPQDILIHFIEAQRFAAIQIGDPNHSYGATSSLRLPLPINEMIARRYEPAGQFPLALYIPKR